MGTPSPIIDLPASLALPIITKVVLYTLIMLNTFSRSPENKEYFNIFKKS
jgi:hypothetical protein